MTELINDKAVCRTAPTTRGLLIIIAVGAKVYICSICNMF